MSLADWIRLITAAARLPPRSEPANSKRLPRRIPGVRLGRLAVDREFQGRRLGELLLLNALDRSRRTHREAGGAALFVDALDEGAADWYRRFGFAAAPENPLLLFLPVAAIGGLLP